jgi:phosphoglycolate phosphatase-like HAD superfamily hydrolase
MVGTDPLSSWTDSEAKRRLLEFVDGVSASDGSRYVTPDARVAVFDNDGTLWCERPVPAQLNFIVDRLAEMTAIEPRRADEEPWRAASEHDFAWFADAVDQHYNGDDKRVTQLLKAIGEAFGQISVEAFTDAAESYLRGTRHPRYGRPYTQLGYEPMRDLLALLEQNEFTTYMVTGGGRDFARPVSQSMYRIPRERVIGSAVQDHFEADGGHAEISRLTEVDGINDGPQKPIAIWDHVGRRPILAAGNANGDLPMLQYTADQPGPSLCLLIDHDDAEREYDYRDGAGEVLAAANEHGWVVASMLADWSTVFSSVPEPAI